MVTGRASKVDFSALAAAVRISCQRSMLSLSRAPKCAPSKTVPARRNSCAFSTGRSLRPPRRPPSRALPVGLVEPQRAGVAVELEEIVAWRTLPLDVEGVLVQLG